MDKWGQSWGKILEGEDSGQEQRGRCFLGSWAGIEQRQGWIRRRRGELTVLDPHTCVASGPQTLAGPGPVSCCKGRATAPPPLAGQGVANAKLPVSKFNDILCLSLTCIMGTEKLVLKSQSRQGYLSLFPPKKKRGHRERSGLQLQRVVSKNLRTRRQVCPLTHEQSISAVGQGGNMQAAFTRKVVL